MPHIYVCVYTYICYIYVCVYTHIYVYIYVCVCIYVYNFTKKEDCLSTLVTEKIFLLKSKSKVHSDSQ